MQKFIWDSDETLLSADFRKEDDFFKEQILDEKVDEFIKNKVKYLMEYERTFLTFCSKKSLTSKVGDELRLLMLEEY